MYRIPNYGKEFETWWSMIGFLVHSVNLDSLANSPNDLVIYHSPSFKYYADYAAQNNFPEPWEIKHEAYRRSLFVYDEYDRVIPLSELYEGIDSYIEEPNHYHWRAFGLYGRGRVFRYRYDPVPYIHKRRGGRYYQKPKNTNKNYCLDVLSVFPEDARIKSQLAVSVKAWDDECPRTIQKSWKEQGKKRHQWS